MDLDAARKHAGLKPLPRTKPPEPTIEVDRTGFMDPEVQRGFPICDQHGFPGGATMRGTRPGDHLHLNARELNEAGTQILRGMLKKARGRLRSERPCP